MAVIKDGLYYSHEHEWAEITGNLARIGITDYAQHSLGDIVFADGEPVGSVLMAGGTAGAVESVKAASDLFSPVSGVVTAINPEVADAPESINSAPYDSWIVEVEMSDASELKDLMNASDYRVFCESL